MRAWDIATDHPPINLTLLQPSRRRLHPGDVFVARPRDHDYLFGRVIRTDAALFGTGNVLIYFYDAWSPDPAVIPALSPAHLLVPPVATNRLGWSRGYFQHVASMELTPSDVLPVHCFVTHMYRDGPRYFDEYNQPLPGPIPPVGDRALHSYRTIDDLVSDAIGLERAPET